MGNSRVAALAVLQVLIGHGKAWAQMEMGPTPAYQVASFYDRVSDSTRVTFSLTKGSRPFGLGSRAWLDLAFAYAGARLDAPPRTVRLTIESSTPAPKGSWAFSGPKPLHVTSLDGFHMELAPAGYTRRVIRSASPQFQDAVSFVVTPEQVRTAAAQQTLKLRAGNARLRLDSEGMQMIREAAHWMATTGEH